MNMPKNFALKYVDTQVHFILPRITSIIVVQNLYDVLFQYAITPEKEQQIKSFIELLEKHIKSKARAPFSIPAEDLNYLEEGLEELKLLNWLKMPVHTFEIQFGDGPEDDEQLENALLLLEDIVTFSRIPDTSRIYIYSASLPNY